MATIVNARDVLLQAASPRLLAPGGAAIILTSTTPIFHIDTGGNADPLGIAFTAKLIGLEGTVTFGVSGGTLTSVSGNSCALLASNMPGATATVTASLTYRGVGYSATLNIAKVVDGSGGSGATGPQGPAGTRGAGSYYASGSVWSDASANTATPDSNVIDDVVTIFNGTTFAETRKWNGSAWVLLTSSVNGNLLTQDSVVSTAIAALAASKITGTLSDSQLAAIAAAKITGQITSTQITDNSITTAKINAGAVTASQIAADTITASQIAANAITSTELAAGAVTAGKITAGTIVAGDIAASTITGAKIAANTIAASNIVAGTITAAEIAAGSITADRINSNGLSVKTVGGVTILDAGGLNVNYAPAGTLNSNVSIGSNGTLSGAGGGTVTIGGLGYSGDLNATYTSPSKGAAINDDPAIENNNAWSIPASITVSTGTSATGAVGNNYFRAASFATSSNAVVFSQKSHVIDPSKTYSLFANLFADSGNDRNMYIIADFFDAAGSRVGTAWGGTYSGYAYIGTPPQGVFTKCGALIGSGTTKPIPATAKTVKVGLIFQHSGSGSSSVVQAAQDFRLVDITEANNKLSRVADDILGSVLSVNAVSAPAGFRAGTLAWDTSGARTSGYGVAMTPSGLVGYTSAGALTFYVNAANGNAYFGGELTAVTGSFGTVTIASGGSISSGQSDYNTGTGFWLGLSSGTPKFSIGTAGGSSLRWDGSNLIINNPTMTLPAFTCSITGSLSSSVASGGQTYGNLTASVTGAVGTLSYTWSIVSVSSDSGGAVQYFIDTGGETSVATPKGVATNNQIHAKIMLIVTDASTGRVAYATRLHNPIHGTYSP